MLISSANAALDAMVPYSRMKAELDQAVKALNINHTVLIKPGLIVGPRRDSRPPEAVARGLANFMGAISGGCLKDFWAQDAEVIGRAAISAGIQY